MMKKLLSVLLVAAMLLSVLPMGIFAEDTDGAAYAGDLHHRYFRRWPDRDCRSLRR